MPYEKAISTWDLIARGLERLPEQDLRGRQVRAPASHATPLFRRAARRANRQPSSARRGAGAARWTARANSSGAPPCLTIKPRSSYSIRWPEILEIRARQWSAL